MRLLLTITVLFFSQSIWAQFPTFNKTLKEALSFEEKNDYYAAYYYYNQLIQFDKEPELYHYKAAMNAMKLKAYITADRHLQHLDTIETEMEFDDLTYYRAVAAHHTGRYDESLVLYKLFISENDSDSLLVEEARNRMESVEWAVYQKPDTLIQIEHLSETVNSPYSDHGVAEINDTSFLFSSNRVLIDRDDYQTRRGISYVFVSPDGKTARPLQGDINDESKHSGNVSFNKDRTMMYYQNCEYIGKTTDIRCDIYKRTFNDSTGLYGLAERLPAPINGEGFTTTQPNIGYDSDGNELLFFASDRPGGKGKSDIWYSRIDSNGLFTEPVNLESINTEKEEWSPNLHELDQELYFSSEGYLGFGSLDIYKCAWNDGEPDQPSNLGAPLNSSFDDVYFSLSRDGNYAYFASNREGSFYRDEEMEACCFDIYKANFTPPPIELLASAFDAFDTTDLLGSIITLFDAETGQEIATKSGDSWDDYIFQIEHEKDYKLRAEQTGYLPSEIEFNTHDARGIEIMEQVLYLEKIVPLTVTVWDENTGEALSGAIIKLYEITDSTQQLLAEESNAEGNDYHYDLIRGRQYLIFGTKTPLYDSANVDITSIETGVGEPIEKRVELVQLAIRNLEKVFPLVLFFDNDQPNPKSKSRTTDKRYGETYRSYISRKSEFVNKYAANLGGTEFGERAEREMDDFFAGEVEFGFNKLQYFMEQLHAVLKGGLLVEVSIKGYTSPIAKGDYNLRLGQRRVQCLKNEFLSWENGALQHYVDIGKLVLKEISFGETKAPEGLSDSALDRRNSVFSPLASKERRVEVIAVRRMAREAQVK